MLKKVVAYMKHNKDMLYFYVDNKIGNYKLSTKK